MSGTKLRWPGLAAAIAMATLVLPGSATALSDLQLVTSGPETVRSLYQVTDGQKKNYANPSSFEMVDLDFGARTITISDFFLPGNVSNIGMNFVLTSVPSTIVGSLTPNNDDTYDITFPGIEIGFERDGFGGTLAFDLTTGQSVIQAGCAGRLFDQVLTGSALDYNTGHVEFVGSVCPYTGFFDEEMMIANEFNDAFRLFIRGTVNNLPVVVPEPGTFAMLAAGLAGLAIRGRRVT